MNYRNWVVTYFLEVLKCCQKHLIHFTGTKSTITQKNSTDYKQSLASFKRGKSKTGMRHKPLEPVSTCCNFPGACLVCLPKQPYLLVLSIQQPCSRKCWELLTSLALQPINYTTATVAKHSPPKGKKKNHIIFHFTEPMSKMKNIQALLLYKRCRTESCCWLLPCPCCTATNPLDGDKQLPNKVSAPWHDLTPIAAPKLSLSGDCSRTKGIWKESSCRLSILHCSPQTTHPMLCAFFPTSIYHAIIYFQQITAQNLKTSSSCHWKCPQQMPGENVESLPFSVEPKLHFRHWGYMYFPCLVQLPIMSLLNIIAACVWMEILGLAGVYSLTGGSVVIVWEQEAGLCSFWWWHWWLSRWQGRSRVLV